MSQVKTYAYWSDGFFDAELETAKINDEMQLFGSDHHKLIQVPEDSTDEQIGELIAVKIKSDLVNGSINPIENISLSDGVYSGFIERWSSGEEKPAVNKNKEVIQKIVCPRMVGGKTFTPSFFTDVMNDIYQRAVSEGYLIDHGHQPGKRRYEVS